MHVIWKLCFEQILHFRDKNKTQPRRPFQIFWMARKFVKLLPANTSALFFFLIKISLKYRYSLIQSSSALNSSAPIMKKKITIFFPKTELCFYVKTNYIEQWLADALCLLWKILTRICMSHSCRKIITSKDLQEIIMDYRAHVFVWVFWCVCFLLFNVVVISYVRSVINKLHIIDSPGNVEF